MATFQLPSAVDPAVRMALTRAGGQKKYLHGYSVRNSYHIRLNYTAVTGFCQEFFIFKYNDARVKSSKSRSCLHDKAFELGTRQT